MASKQAQQAQTQQQQQLAKQKAAEAEAEKIKEYIAKRALSLSTCADTSFAYRLLRSFVQYTLF